METNPSENLPGITEPPPEVDWIESEPGIYEAPSSPFKSKDCLATESDPEPSDFDDGDSQAQMFL